MDINWIVLAVGIVQAVYAALTYHRDRASAMAAISQSRPRRPIFIIASFMLLTWAAVGFNFYQQRYLRGSPLVIYQWGTELTTDVHTSVYYMTIDATPVLPERDNSKLMLINRVVYSDVDRMTDTHIEKSGLFTITPGPIRVAKALKGAGKLSVSLDGRQTNLEYNLILMPNRFSPDQILSLSDVDKIGGKILASTVATNHYTANADQQGTSQRRSAGPCDIQPPPSTGQEKLQ